MDPTSDLAFRAEQLKEKVLRACARSGRDPSSVRIVPAVKTQSAETVNALLSLGFCEVGENRVQEFLQKVAAVRPEMRWHFIGQLQTNKVKYLIDRVSCIQSLDRPELAREIDRKCVSAGKTMPCLIEINIARNPSHGGVLPEDALDFAKRVRETCPSIELRGIMGVLPKDGEARKAAREMAKISQTLASAVPGMIECSMGMSEDLETAIECGATLVRPGRILFGERQPMR